MTTFGHRFKEDLASDSIRFINEDSIGYQSLEKRFDFGSQLRFQEQIDALQNSFFKDLEIQQEQTGQAQSSELHCSAQNIVHCCRPFFKKTYFGVHSTHTHHRQQCTMSDRTL